MVDDESVFLMVPEDDHLIRGKCFFVIRDRFPVSPGHCLIVSRAQKTNYFELDEKEQAELCRLIHEVRTWIEENYSPEGYNIGMNCGRQAGQTVMHFHCHVIPRYTGDMDDPSGGIRHCVDGKGRYETF